jgi:hypothetical protein
MREEPVAEDRHEPSFKICLGHKPALMSPHPSSQMIALTSFAALSAERRCRGYCRLLRKKRTISRLASGPRGSV